MPYVPQSNELNVIQREAQDVLVRLVSAAGGRFESTQQVPVDDLQVLTNLLEHWGRQHATQRGGTPYFSGRPGLWHALDDLVPLQDPNRWDNLRAAIIEELQVRGWVRRTPPRGSAFDLPG